MVTHCEAQWQICACEMVLFREWFSIRSLQAMNLNNNELPAIRLSWTEFCNCFNIKKIQELCVNKRLSKQSRHQWFKKTSRSLWRHCIGTNGYNKYLYIIQNSIPEMSHERHGFPDHRLFECLLNNSFFRINISSRYWPFVRVNHPWPVDSPHKGPVTRKKFPFHDVFMLCLFLLRNGFVRISNSNSWRIIAGKLIMIEWQNSPDQ